MYKINCSLPVFVRHAHVIHSLSSCYSAAPLFVLRTLFTARHYRMFAFSECKSNLFEFAERNKHLNLRSKFE